MGAAGVGWAGCGMSSELTAVNFSAFTIRSAFEASSVRRLAALGLICSVVSCAPGEVKDGLGPDETAVAAVEVTPERSSIVVGEAVLVRASARTLYPRSSRAGTRWPPMYPVAPVTRQWGLVAGTSSPIV